MSDQQPAPSPPQANNARAAAERRLKMTDAEVVEHCLEQMPLHVRAVLAAPLRPLLASLIARERARCVDVLNIGVKWHQMEVRRIEGAITAAIAAGQPADELALQRTSAIAQVLAVANCAKAVSIAPGSCSRCGGTQKIPSSIVLSGGQVPMLPCPACTTNSASALASASSATTAPASNDPGTG